MLGDVYEGVSVGVILGCALMPFLAWAWVRVRLTEWWVLFWLVALSFTLTVRAAELWAWWSLSVALVAVVTAYLLTRRLSVRLREPGYRPTGFFPFGKTPPGVQNWMRD